MKSELQVRCIDSARAKAAKAPKRKHRNMFRDEKGVWWLDFYAPNGKRRRKKAGKTKSSADRLLRSIRTSIDAGTFVDSAISPTFTEFCATFLERHGNHLVSYAKNGGILQRLKDYFGKTKLTKISSGHLEDYRLQRLAEPSARDGKSPLSRTTVNREIEIVRSMLSCAVRWGYLGKNVARAVEDYEEDNHREKFLTADETRRLLQAAKQSTSPILRTATYLALETGMRKAELLGLKWTDINFESWKILCRETKTGEPRHVPLSRRAAWVLQKRAARDPLSVWVFETKRKDGTRRPAKDTKTAWATCLRKAKIHEFRWHDLRHSFASNFAMKGGNLYALAEILGHSNPLMTLKRYTHLSPAYIAEQRRVMDSRAFTAGAT
jgi:integrase